MGCFGLLQLDLHSVVLRGSSKPESRDYIEVRLGLGATLVSESSFAFLKALVPPFLGCLVARSHLNENS